MSKSQNPVDLKVENVFQTESETSLIERLCNNIPDSVEEKRDIIEYVNTIKTLFEKTPLAENIIKQVFKRSIDPEKAKALKSNESLKLFNQDQLENSERKEFFTLIIEKSERVAGFLPKEQLGQLIDPEKLTKSLIVIILNKFKEITSNLNISQDTECDIKKNIGHICDIAKKFEPFDSKKVINFLTFTLNLLKEVKAESPQTEYFDIGYDIISNFNNGYRIILNHNPDYSNSLIFHIMDDRSDTYNETLQEALYSDTFQESLSTIKENAKTIPITNDLLNKMIYNGREFGDHLFIERRFLTLGDDVSNKKDLIITTKDAFEKAEAGESKVAYLVSKIELAAIERAKTSRHYIYASKMFEDFLYNMPTETPNPNPTSTEATTLSNEPTTALGK